MHFTVSNSRVVYIGDPELFKVIYPVETRSRKFQNFCLPEDISQNNQGLFP